MITLPHRNAPFRAPAAALAVAVLALAATAPQGAAWAQSTAPGSASVARLVTPEEGRLSNGLRVLSLVDPAAPVATLQVWYDSGSRNERPGITGITHLFEHMMFKGTKKVKPEEHARLIEAVGGVTNAFTSWDATGYWQALPPEHLELAARLEADRMANLQLTEATLASEREVVKEERRFRVDGNPIGRGIELLSSLAYDASPYAWPIGGWPGDVDAITLQDCKDYYALHYSPDKATVIIAGPTTHEANMKLVSRHFGGLKRGAPAPRVLTGDMRQQGERRAELKTEVQLPIMLAGFKVPPDSSADTPAIEVVANLLSTGQSSRLYRKLVYEDQSALFAGGAAVGRRDIGLFYMFAAVKPGKDRDSVETTFFAEVEKLAHDPVPDAELAKVKNQMEAQFIFGLQAIQDRAEAVGNAALVTGDPRAAGTRLERLRAVTAADVQRVVRRYLVPDNRTLVWVLPAGRAS